MRVLFIQILIASFVMATAAPAAAGGGAICSSAAYFLGGADADGAPPSEEQASAKLCAHAPARRPRPKSGRSRP